MHRHSQIYTQDFTHPETHTIFPYRVDIAGRMERLIWELCRAIEETSAAVLVPGSMLSL